MTIETSRSHLAGAVHALAVARNLVVLASLELQVREPEASAGPPGLSPPIRRRLAALERLRQEMTTTLEAALDVERSLTALVAGQPDPRTRTKSTRPHPEEGGLHTGPARSKCA